MSDLLTQKMNAVLDGVISKKEALSAVPPEFQTINRPVASNLDANGMPKLEGEGGTSLAQKLIDSDTLRRGNPLLGALTMGSEVANSFTKQAGNFGAGVVGFGAANTASQVTDEAKAAFARKLRGQHTPEDQALLSKPYKMEMPYESLGDKMDRLSPENTNENALKRVGNLLDVAGDIKRAGDYSEYIDQTRAKKLQEEVKGTAASGAEDLSKGFKNFTDGEISAGLIGMSKGATDIAGGVLSSAVSNPFATGQLVAGQVGQVAGALLGPAGLAFNAASYGGGTLSEGLSEKVAANGGAIPTNNEINKTAAHSVAAAALDVVGDIAMVGAGKALKGVMPNTAEVGAKIAAEAVEKGATSALASAGKFLASPATSFAKGAAGEFGTEGAQQYFEEAAKGKDATFADMIEAGMMGAIAGGAIRTGADLVGNTGKAADTVTKAVVKKAATSAESFQAYKEVLKTKDTTPFTDEASPTFAPDKAIDALREISYGAKNNPELREENIAKAEVINTSVSDELRAVKEATAIKKDPAKAEAFKARVADEVKALEEHRETYKDNPTALKEIEAEQARTEAYAARTLTLAERETPASLKARLVQFDGIKKNATSSLKKMNDEFGSADEVTAAIEKVASTKANTTEGTAAVSHILKLAMTTPEKLNEEKVAALVADTNNSLPTEERAYLTAWIKAREAAKGITKMNKVSNAVVSGDPKLGFAGVDNYRQKITNSINNGNTFRTNHNISELTKWADYYKGKAEAVNKAYELTLEDGTPYYPLRNKETGEWEISSTPNGGMKIHENSNKSGLIDNINAESILVKNTLEELKLAVNVKKSIKGLKANQSTSTPSPTPATGDAAAKGQGAQRSEQPASPVAKAGAGSSASAEKTTPTPTVTQKANATEGKTEEVKASPDLRVSDQINSSAVPLSTVSSVETASRSSSDTSKGSQQNSSSDAATQGKNEKVEQNPSTDKKVVKDGVNSTPSTVDALGLATQGNTDTSVGLQGETRGVQDGQTQAEAPSPSKEPTESTVPSAQISVLSDPDNYFTQQFTQKEPAAVESNPLLAIKDFASTWLKMPEIVEAFLPAGTFGMGREAERVVNRALNHFSKGIQSMNDTLRKSFSRPAKPLTFQNKDMVQALLREVTNEKGETSLDMDENILTAISSAAYSFVLEKANAGANTDSEIARMHGMQEEDLKFDEKNGYILRSAISFAHSITSDLGQEIVRSLGIKPKETTGIEAIPLLETALGVHAFELLKTIGAIKVENIPVADVKSWLSSKPAPVTEQGKFPETSTYVFLQRESDRVQNIKKANKSTGQIVSKLFDKEKQSKAAYREPQEYKQKTLKNSDMSVPALTRRVLQKEMNEGWKIIPEMYEAMQALGRANMLKVAGFKNTNNLHAVNRDSAQAQNENLETQYDSMEEDVESPLNKDGINSFFYIVSEVWKNHRAGIATQSINPQSSKIHRFAMQKDSWTNYYDFKDSEQMDQFILAIAAGTGLVKTDQQSDENSINSFLQKASEPAFQALTATAKKIVNKETVSEKEGNALAAFAANNEGTQTLQAMLAYAKYQIAKDTEGSLGFEATLAVGVDGKTNGPILSMLALGAAALSSTLLKTLERGGLYTAESAEKSFNNWYALPGNNDLYQHLSFETFQEAFKNEKHKATVEAFQFFTGNFLADGKVTKAGRNAIKKPLTAFNFGSSLFKSALSMQEWFEDSIYESIEKASAGTKEEQQKYINDFVEAINTIVGKGTTKDTKPTYLNAANLTMHDLMHMSLFPKQGYKSILPNKKNFDAAFYRAIGAPMNKVFKTEFAVYIERRNALTTASNSIHNIYELVFAEKKAEFMLKLMDEGRLPFINSKKTGKKVPKRDLTESEMRELDEFMGKYMPITNSTFSVENGKLNTGLYLGKTKIGKNKASMYQSSVNINGANINEYAVTRDTEAPGAGAMAGNLHSYDSGIMKRTQDAIDGVLNNHDEGTTGLTRVPEMAENLNKHTLEGFYEFSPMTETIGRLADMMQNLLEDVAAKRLSPETLEIFAASGLFEATPVKDGGDPTGESVLDTLVSNLKASFIIKSAALEQITNVDQYTYQTGTFEVTAESTEKMEAAIEKERARIKDILKKLDRFVKIHDANSLKDSKISVDASFLSEVNERNVTDILEGTTTPAEIKTSADLSLTPGIENTVVSALVATVATNAQPTVSSLTKVQAEVAKSPQAGVAGAVATLPSTERAEAVEALSKAGRAIPASLVSPFGELGRTENETHQRMATTMEANPVMDKKASMALLKNLIKEMPESPKRTFFGQLFNVMLKTLPDSTRVIYLTPETAEVKGLSFGEREAAITVLNKDTGGTDIYVLSTDHKYSMVNFEMLMHELTHAALGRVIENSSLPGADPEVKQLVENLNKIMQKAQKVAEKMPEFAPAFSSIHEFVSWGMSNTAFQDKVLGTFNIRTKLAGNSFVKAAVEFMNTIRGMLFGSKANSPAINNGFSQFVQNTSALMEASKAQPSGIQASLNLGITAAKPVDKAFKAPLVEIFDSLLTTSGHMNSENFNAQLKDIAYKTSLGALGLGNKEVSAIINGAPKTSLDIYQDMLNDGDILHPDAYAVGLQFSPQEAFVASAVQSVMEDIMKRGRMPTDLTYRELQNIYEDVRKQMTPADFLPKGVTAATANAGDMAVATATYESVFAASKDRNHLARFAAIATSNEQFAKMLENLPEITKEKPATIAGKLLDMVSRVADYIKEVITGTRKALDTAEAINILVKKLARNEIALREAEVKRLTKDSSFFDDSKEAVDGAINKAIAVSGNVLQKSGFKVVSITGTALTMLGGDRAKLAGQYLRTVRDKMMKSRDGFFATMMTEVIGTEKHVEALLRFVKTNEKFRQQTRTELAKFVKEGFSRQDFTQDEYKAITNTMLRTDAQMLLKDFSLEEIRDMLTDVTKLDAAIALDEKTLKGTSYANFYIGQSKTLGMYLATERTTSNHMLLNAHNIVRLSGTNQQGQVTEDQIAQLEPVIDRLVSLYALRYSNGAELANTAKIFTSELERSKKNPEDQGNGIEQILKMHTQLQADSKNRLFWEAPALFTKGYLPEITDPNISVKAVNIKDGVNLVKQGWVKVNNLQLANHDNVSEPKSLFTRKDGGMSKYESGIMSLTDTHAKGSAVSYDNSYDVGSIKGTIESDATKMFKGNFDPRGVKEVFMVPKVNATGKVVNYSYRMSRNVRDNLLARDNRFHILLGTMASNIQDKVDSANQNSIAVDALHAQYQAERFTKSSSFIAVSPKSNDASIRENWNMLPEATKRYIEDTFEGKVLYVRADMFNIFFGSRLPSLGDLFNKPESERNIREKIITKALELVVKNTYYATKMVTGKYVTYMDAGEFAAGQTDYRLRKAEQLWQEIVKHLKQNIVIKNIDVLLGNISSNLSLLVLADVPLKDIYRHHVDAIRAAEDYQKNFARKIQLESALRSDFTNQGGRYALEQELIRVNEAIDRNPAKALMDAGLMPTIVEDIDTSEDIYSYKSQLVRKTEGIVKWIPKPVRNVSKQLYMTDDTKSFKFLSKSTQMSDFVARYTLVQHTMNRKKNPLSEADAMHFASEAFINYDLPSHRYMNYANSVGLVMFTKYYLRIQRVIGYLMKTNPSRALMMQILHFYMAGLPILFDSFFLGRLGNNPFSTGIFQYPGTVGNIAMMEGATYPFN